MRLFLVLVAACLMASAPSAAQSKKKRTAAPAPKAAPPPEEVGELREYPIASLDVEGNSLYSSAAVIAASGLKVGDGANKELFEAARDRLLATGAFDSVGYRYFNGSDGRSYDAVWQIAEATPVYPYRFEDLGAPAAEIDAWIKTRDPLFGPSIPPTRARIESWRKLIDQFLESKNTGTGTIEGKVEADAPGNLAVVFRIAGNQPAVADVRFTGNQALQAGALKPAINGVAVGIPYNEARFRQLLETSVRPLYEQRGRLNVTFPKVVAEPSPKVKGVNVEVTIDEGEVFLLGDVKLQGPPTLPESDLIREADFKTGDIANMAAVREGAERMREYLSKLGYIMAIATPDRHINLAEKKVDLVIGVDPGDQYSFSSLSIEGLDILSEPVIRKMWALEVGQPYNSEYAERFLKRIEEDGIFENLGKTAVREKPDAAAKTVGVTLVFGAAAETKSILKNQPDR